MAFKQFSTITTSNTELSQVQSHIKNFADPIVKNTNLDFAFLPNIQLISSSYTPIPHKLGRVYQGWRLAGIQGNSNVWEDVADNKSPELFLYLNCSSNVIVSIEVF